MECLLIFIVFGLCPEISANRASPAHMQPDFKTKERNRVRDGASILVLCAPCLLAARHFSSFAPPFLVPSEFCKTWKRNRSGGIRFFHLWVVYHECYESKRKLLPTKVRQS